MGYLRNRGTKSNPRWYATFKNLDGNWKERLTGQPDRSSAQTWLNAVEGRIAFAKIGAPANAILSAYAPPRLKVPDTQGGRLLLPVLSPTLAEVFARFLMEYRPRTTNLENYRKQAAADFNKRVLPYLGKRPMVSITKADIEDLCNKLQEKDYAAGSVNSMLRRLSTVYNWAIEREIVVCKSPVADVDRLHTSPLDEYFSVEDVDRLLRPKPPWARTSLAALAATGLYTGMRRGELYALTKPCVRFDFQRIDVDQQVKPSGELTLPKGGKKRQIPIHPELGRILRAWWPLIPETPEQLVFPFRKDGLYVMGYGDEMTAEGKRQEDDAQDIRSLLRDLGCQIPTRYYHALRHTFATAFRDAGGTEDALGKIMGHSPKGNPVTAGYSHHLTLNHLARELAKLSYKRPR